MLGFNTEKLEQKLKEDNFTEEEIEKIVENVTTQAIELEFVPKNFKFYSGKDVEIKMVSLDKGKTADLKDGEIPNINLFDIKIKGLDSSMIQSVEIPKLDYSSNGGALVLKLSIIPFKFIPFRIGENK